MVHGIAECKQVIKYSCQSRFDGGLWVIQELLQAIFQKELSVLHYKKKLHVNAQRLDMTIYNLQ